MDIHVEERIPYVYWQAITFDRYIDGNRAISESDEVLHFPDEGDLNTGGYLGRKEIVQTVVNLLPSSGTIHGAPEILNTDRQIFVTQNDDEANKEIYSVQSRFVMR
jgi:hypothetical protein